MKSAGKPEDDKHKHYEREDTPKTTPAVSAMGIIAAAAAEQQYQYDDDQNRSQEIIFLL